jgi:hypothetical protein
MDLSFIEFAGSEIVEDFRLEDQPSASPGELGEVSADWLSEAD